MRIHKRQFKPNASGLCRVNIISQPAYFKIRGLPVAVKDLKIHKKLCYHSEPKCMLYIETHMSYVILISRHRDSITMARHFIQHSLSIIRKWRYFTQTHWCVTAIMFHVTRRYHKYLYPYCPKSLPSHYWLQELY